VLGDPLAEQAKGPFLNLLEQALASPEELCAKVSAGTYTSLFEQVWGAGPRNCADAETVYDQIGISIAAYERSAEFNPYNSKFDQFWDKAKAKRLDVTKITVSNWTKYRKLGFNDTELYGLAVFNDPTQANCASCHSMQPGSKGYPLLTDYSYDNLGVPRNPENPFYSNLAYNPAGTAWVDTGLGGFLETVQPARRRRWADEGACSLVINETSGRISVGYCSSKSLKHYIIGRKYDLMLRCEEIEMEGLRRE
jgi:cytochrome c peroxidase